MKKEDINADSNKNNSKTLTDYRLLSHLFMYPLDAFYKSKVHEVYEYLLAENQEAAEALARFVDFTHEFSTWEMQELFLRSFDLQAITTLDIGFILFGEDYKRGKLLVHLNEEHKNAENDCHTELADHLPNLLRLLPKMKDEEMRAEIATKLLLPAVVKMIGEFSPEKIEKKDVVYKKHQKVILEYSQNYRTVYQSCLQVLFIALKKDFGYEPEEEKKVQFSDPNNPASNAEGESEQNFKENIESEMKLEQ